MRRLLLLSLAAVGLALTSGCSDTVDPTLGTDQVFSLYGYIDPSADLQAIRVVEIGRTIGSDTSRTLAATVTSTETGTGATQTWRDSTVTYSDGSIGHVFVADYTPTPGSRVTLSATAPDGRTASVEVDVPPLARAELGGPENVGGFTTYPVTVNGVPRLLGGTIRVRVTNVPQAPSDTLTLTVPVDEYDIRQEGSGWVVVVPFVEATQAYLQSRSLFRAGLTLIEAEFAAFVANDAWAIPPGGFDEDAVVQPGTFSNVSGGFGFVGAGYEAPVRWLPSPGTQSRAGFTIDGDPAGLLTINEVGPGFVELYNPSAEPVDVGGYVVSEGTVEEGTIIPNPSRVNARGFLVVNGPFEAVAGRTVRLLSSSGRQLGQSFIEEDATSWGSYPDGLSYILPQGGPDIFRGPVTSSPGRANRPAFVPAVINEISTSGEGFVEVLPTYTFFRGARLSSDPTELAFNGVDAQPEGSYFVAEEGGTLTLEQTGGTVYLLADFGNAKLADEPLRYRVVDARTFGPQDLGRALGYLPDGPSGTWSAGLLPSRGAPNAAARFVGL